jgi:hypothetical protein
MGEERLSEERLSEERQGVELAKRYEADPVIAFQQVVKAGWAWSTPLKMGAFRPRGVMA